MRKLFILISILALSITAHAAIPSTDFASEYAFTGTAATLEDGLIKETHWGEDRAYIRYDGGMHSFAAASWEVQSTRSGFVNVRVYTATNEWEEHTSSPYGNSGHNFSVEIYNSSEVRLDTIAEGVYAPSPWDGYRTYPAEGIALGTLYIPEAGTYTIKLKNMRDYSRCGVDSVTFTYAGGERINIPDTLRPIDAICSTRARNTVDTLFFAPADHEGYAADANYTVAGSEYGKWNIKVSKNGMYKFTANTYCKQGHNYRFILLNQAENDTILKYQEAAGNDHAWGSQGSDLLVSTNAVHLSPGSYVLKMQARAFGRVMWVAATYVGGDTIQIPATLQPVDALRSERAFINENGEFRFTDDGHDGYVTTQYGKWNIRVNKAGYYAFTLNANSDNSHSYKLSILNADESEIQNFSFAGSSNTPLTATTGNVNLAVGNYIIKIENTKNNSHGRILDVVANYAGGALISIPGVLPSEEAVLERTKMYRDENGYIHYGDNGAETPDEYAFWKIRTTAAYSGKVILDIPQENISGHEIHVELYSALDGSKLSDAYEAADQYTKGLIELSQTFEISEAGDYYIKIVNHKKWSKVTLRGISIAPTVTISETATDLENLTEGAAVNVQLTRSLVAGMYNTICLPFAVSAAEKERVFPGAVVKELTSSSVEEGDFVLNLNFSAVSEMAAGVPYIIKPAADVVNPKFIGVTIDKTLNPVNTTNANFVGNFVAGTIPASENNLFLGANNTLYFPTVDMEILGMRAYFEVIAPAGAVKRARIIEREQVITDVELVAEQPSAKSQKILRDGKLIIIRDGNMYNVMGAKLQ